MLCRHARRDHLRLRSRLHVRRPPMKGDNRARATVTLSALNFGRYPHVERHHAARDPLPRRARQCRQSQGAIGKPLDASDARSPRPRHRELRRGRLGRRGAHLPRGARIASRPTASPASRQTCASPAPRPWRPRSSAASPPGRTGSSTARCHRSEGALRRYGTGLRATSTKPRIKRKPHLSRRCAPNTQMRY